MEIVEEKKNEEVRAENKKKEETKKWGWKRKNWGSWAFDGREGGKEINGMEKTYKDWDRRIKRRVSFKIKANNL